MHDSCWLIVPFSSHTRTSMHTAYSTISTSWAGTGRSALNICRWHTESRYSNRGQITHQPKQTVQDCINIKVNFHQIIISPHTMINIARFVIIINNIMIGYAFHQRYNLIQKIHVDHLIGWTFR
jgi:hypothetical protein